MKNGTIRYIEGNRDHPVNRGALCAKGAAGRQQQAAPTRLTSPMKRVGPRGSGEFKEISWAEALKIATVWLGRIRASDPKKLAFYTGQDQSQALTRWWARQFGTPNYGNHGGVCSVNMTAAGLYTIGGSFGEHGEPDWERARYLLMFGCAEDQGSNALKRGLSTLKGNGAKIVTVNPVRSGYAAIADEWIGIRPGTDGLFILSIVQELLKAGKIDVDYLIRYTNAPWLVFVDEGPAQGLFVRTADDKPIVWDREQQQARVYDDLSARPALKGEVMLASGRKAVPAFQLLVERYLDPSYSPDWVSEETGIPADVIRRIAAELATIAFEQEIVIEQPWTDCYGRKHERMIGRPVAMHAMRGLAAHSNGFQTCRALHLLQALLGTIDCPGGFRYKPPFPRATPPDVKPVGKAEDIAPRQQMPGPPLGFPAGPEDLLVDHKGRPSRLDKAFSWEAPFATDGLIQNVIANAYHGDPYPIDTLFLHMANLAGRSAIHADETIRMLTERDEASGSYRIPRLICSDAYASEMVAYADLVLPDTTFFERWDCLSILDGSISSADGPADGIRQPVIEPDRNVRPFQDVLLELGARLRLPRFTFEDGTPRYPGGYADYLVNHQRRPGIGSLMGWRGKDGGSKGKGVPNPDQLQRYVENGCFWQDQLAPEARFFKQANRAYLDYAVEMGFIDEAEPIFHQLYSEVLQKFRLAALGHSHIQPPELHRERIRAFCDPLPFWYPPFEDLGVDEADFPLHAITQRSMTMDEGRSFSSDWLQGVQGDDDLYIGRQQGKELGIADEDWVWVISRRGKVKRRVRLMDGVHSRTVWTWRGGARSAGQSQGPPASQSSFNLLIDDRLPEQDSEHQYASADPLTGQTAWFDLRVRLEPAEPDEEALPAPQPTELVARKESKRKAASLRLKKAKPQPVRARKPKRRAS